ncbi:unnamed protein product [Mesocestoides corti]|uniref:Uncharacterized protein n=1 Tax=Mesocestoides corti TaxID=53468 RepID=A0A0R3U877_MESCO|nr:unnamed protein product [Mesocestoides corti]
MDMASKQGLFRRWIELVDRQKLVAIEPAFANHLPQQREVAVEGEVGGNAGVPREPADVPLSAPALQAIPISGSSLGQAMHGGLAEDEKAGTKNK